MFFADVGREVFQHPGIDECLQRGQSLLRVQDQDFLQELSEAGIGDDATDGLSAREDCLSVLALDYFGGEVFVEVLRRMFAPLHVGGITLR